MQWKIVSCAVGNAQIKLFQFTDPTCLRLHKHAHRSNISMRMGFILYTNKTHISEYN